MSNSTVAIMLAPQAVTSPCIKNCCLNEQDVCLGCWRSLDEIKQWRLVDDSMRQHFIENTQQRRKIVKLLIV